MKLSRPTGVRLSRVKRIMKQPPGSFRFRFAAMALAIISSVIYFGLRSGNDSPRTELGGKLIRSERTSLNPHGKDTTTFTIFGRRYENVIGENLMYSLSPSGTWLLFACDSPQSEPSRILWCVNLNDRTVAQIPSKYYVGAGIGSVDPVRYDRIISEGSDHVILESSSGEHRWVYRIDLAAGSISEISKTR